MRYVFSFAFLIALASPASADRAASERWPDHSCVKDSDCVAMPEVWRDCFFYCSETTCRSAKACPVVNREKIKTFQFPDCARNVPCITPKLIRCENGVCKAVI